MEVFVSALGIKILCPVHSTPINLGGVCCLMPFFGRYLFGVLLWKFMVDNCTVGCKYFEKSSRNNQLFYSLNVREYDCYILKCVF